MDEAVVAPVGPTADARLRIEGLSKTFPGVDALTEVSLDIRPSEIHALVGPNGSGKSTFIKVLSGFESADPGASAWLDSVPVEVPQLSHAGNATNLAFVHQNLGLVLELSALDNFALRTGFARGRLGHINPREQERLARELLAPLGMQIDLHRPLVLATPVERTMVAIAMALHHWDPRTGVLILDEPTAALPHHEVARLSQVLKRLRTLGAGILYVSHRLDEIFDLADRVTVFRNGRHIITAPLGAMTKRGLVAQMLGHDADDPDIVRTSEQAASAPALEVSRINGPTVHDVSFTLAKGEVLGLAGLLGSGCDELPRLLSDRGAQATSGELRLAGSDWQRIPRSANAQIALVPPDRGREGILQAMSVKENLTISTLGSLRSGGWLSRRREHAFANEWIQDLGVVTSGLDNRIENLSGGNQQKVIIGRILSRSPAVLLLCEPTAGVDVGARTAIYRLVRAQVDLGIAVIVSSSDTNDLLALCDRVLVFRTGRVHSELSAAELSEARLVNAMEGASGEDDDEARSA